MKSHLSIKLLFVTLFFIGIFTMVSKTQSQVAPIFWVTWKAENYSAPGFSGKSLPSNNTPISIAFELILNGNVVDLKPEEIRWYVDGAFVAKSLGLKEYSFKSNIGTGTHSIRIEIPKFQKGNSLMKNIQIPVSRPEIVLDSPYSKSSVTSNQLVLEAHPYFFNVNQISGLMWGWKINNVAPENLTEKPNKITVDFPVEMPSGSQVLVNVEARNILKNTERAETMSLFTIL